MNFYGQGPGEPLVAGKETGELHTVAVPPGYSAQQATLGRVNDVLGCLPYCIMAQLIRLCRCNMNPFAHYIAVMSP